jgi:rod shape-determining protein MreD
MSRAPGALQPWRWIGVPMLQALFWTIVFGAPLRIFGLQLPEPVFVMWPVFAWAMIRPAILAPFAVLLLGLCVERFWGAPSGLWSVALLVAYGTVLFSRSMMLGQSTPMMFAWYAAVTAIAMGVAYLITMSRTGAGASVWAVAWQYLATILLYPFSHRLIERFEDADVRFR